MPAAYEGTDIISCLRSKYIIRRKPYIILRSNISFLQGFKFIRKTSKNIFFVAYSHKKEVLFRELLFYFPNYFMNLRPLVAHPERLPRKRRASGGIAAEPPLLAACGFRFKSCHSDQIKEQMHRICSFILPE